MYLLVTLRYLPHSKCLLFPNAYYIDDCCNARNRP